MTCSRIRSLSGAESSSDRRWRRGTVAITISKGFQCGWPEGGVKPGITWGATDELGYQAVENVFHVHDLHATMLYLLGIDHERLTYFSQGRDYRLTDIHGNVVKDILA